MGLALGRSCGWEDPRLVGASGGDALVFEPSGDDALGLLGVGAVSAVVATPEAFALVDLKRTAAQHLPLQSVRSLLGFGHFGRRIWFYHYLRPYLHPSARAVWDAQEPAIREGICGLGAVEQELGRLRRLLPVLVGTAATKRLVEAQTVEEHQACLAREWGRRWAAALAIAAPRAARLAGADGRDAAHVLSRRLAEAPLRESPFAAHALLGDAASVALLDASASDPPRTWLSTAGLARAKANLDTLSVSVGTRADVLREQRDIWSLVILGRAPLAGDERVSLARALRPGGRAVGWGPPPDGARLLVGDRSIFPGIPWIYTR